MSKHFYIIIKYISKQQYLNTLYSLLKAGKSYGQLKVKPFNISSTENYICAYLYFHSDVNQDRIAIALGMDKTTVAKALLKLKQKGFILKETNPNNRRENIITLTPLGYDQISPIAHLQQEWIEKVSSCLSDKELSEFNRISEKLLYRAQSLLQEVENER